MQSLHIHGIIWIGYICIGNRWFLFSFLLLLSQLGNSFHTRKMCKTQQKNPLKLHYFQCDPFRVKCRQITHSCIGMILTISCCCCCSFDATNFCHSNEQCLHKPKNTFVPTHAQYDTVSIGLSTFDNDTQNKLSPCKCYRIHGLIIIFTVAPYNHKKWRRINSIL